MYKTVATMHHPMPSSYSKSHIATCLVLVLLLVPIANAGKPPSNVPLVAVRATCSMWTCPEAYVFRSYAHLRTPTCIQQGDRVLVTFQGGPKPTDQVKDKGLRLTTQVAESQAAAYRITDGTPLRKKIEQLSALPGGCWLLGSGGPSLVVIVHTPSALRPHTQHRGHFCSAHWDYRVHSH